MNERYAIYSMVPAHTGMTHLIGVARIKNGTLKKYIKLKDKPGRSPLKKGQAGLYILETVNGKTNAKKAFNKWKRLAPLRVRCIKNLAFVNAIGK